MARNKYFYQRETGYISVDRRNDLIAGKHVSDAVYDDAINLLGQQYTTEVMMAIIAMNAWNRIGITTGRKAEV